MKFELYISHYIIKLHVPVFEKKKIDRTYILKKHHVKSSPCDSLNVYLIHVFNCYLSVN